MKTKASCVYNVLDLGKKRSLSKAKVELVITLFTQMAVHHLPRLASDYPEENKSNPNEHQDSAIVSEMSEHAPGTLKEPQEAASPGDGGEK